MLSVDICCETYSKVGMAKVLRNAADAIERGAVEGFEFYLIGEEEDPNK